MKLNINDSEKVKNKIYPATIALKFLCFYIAVRNVKPLMSVAFVVSAINAPHLAIHPEY